MNIQQQVESLAGSEDPHLEKVAVTRSFLKAVHAKFLELQEAAKARTVCPCCEAIPTFQIPERDDGPHAKRMFAAIARFNAVEAN